ncbi:MAG TPA: glycosyltransferase [Bryobacteraceae bacterium]|nr:glycosyltransferase [Bryobacteraceae bacterium]
MIPNLRSLRFRPEFHPEGRELWSGHLPFAVDAVDVLRPAILVELGTGGGGSYFGLCQAVQEASMRCHCYAVDTWEEGSNRGGLRAFEAASKHNAGRYSGFSHLLRMTSTEAARLFLDGAVDLLHINWCSAHAILHEFETWLPKVSRGGLILIHKIVAQGEDSGGWRLWAETARRFPSFAFWHGGGLGVLANGALADLDHPLLSALFKGACDPQTLRDYYFLCAERLSYEPFSADWDLVDASQPSLNRRPNGDPRPGRSHEITKFQVFSPDNSGYSDRRSQTINLRLNEWVVLESEVLFPSARLRVDPCETVSLIEISGITVQDSVTGNLLWRLDPASPGEIDCGGTAVRIPSNDVLAIVSFGNDPQVFLPSFETPASLEKLRLQCRLRIDPGFSSFPRAFQALAALLSETRVQFQESLANAAETLRQEQRRREEQANEWAIQRQQLEASLAQAAGELQQERQRRMDQLDAFALQRQQLEAEISRLGASAAQATAELQEERRRNREQRVHSQKALASAENRWAAMQRTVESMRHSKSWRLTAPLRMFGGAALKAHRILLRAFYESPAFPYAGKPLAKMVYAGWLPGAGVLLPPNPLFDSDFYALSNPDVSKAKNQWAHYIGFGADERRNPHPMFDSRYYMARNPDVVQAGLNPLIHYYSFGAAELRQPHPEFDPAQYLDARDDVRESGMNPLLHYWKHGRCEQALLKDASADPEIAGKPPGEPQVPAAMPPNGPLISILLPVFNAPAGILRQAIESVLRQSYPRWQLCIYDDGSSKEGTLSVLREYSARGDSRIVIQYGKDNAGISRASNAALEQALGDYVGMLDHDDELHPNALSEIAALLRSDPSVDVVYTDHDTIDQDGHQIRTAFKPDWSPEFFRGVMFVNHLLVARATLIRQVGGFDPRFDRIQDFELMLRLSERTDKIFHIPQILYHWRSLPGSVAASEDAKGKLEHLQAAAVNAHLGRLGIAAIAAPHPSLPHRLRIRPAARSTYPRVVIAVRESGEPSTNLTVLSVLNQSSYPNFVVAVPPGLSPGLPADRRIFVATLEDTHARLARGEFLVWIDDGLEVASADWIETLLMYCQQPDIGCASPVIRVHDKVWCAGLMLGPDRMLTPSMRDFPADSDGYIGSLSCAREVISVSGECLMVSTSVFLDLGGSVKYYSKSFFDGADLAFRARAAGRRNIVTPQAWIKKQQALASRNGWRLDEALFSDRWDSLMQKGDPYFNQNALSEFPTVGSVAATA